MKRGMLFIAILLLPMAIHSQTIVPQLLTYDAASITLSWAAVPGATAYNIWLSPDLAT